VTDRNITAASAIFEMVPLVPNLGRKTVISMRDGDLPNEAEGTQAKFGPLMSWDMKTETMIKGNWKTLRLTCHLLHISHPLTFGTETQVLFHIMEPTEKVLHFYLMIAGSASETSFIIQAINNWK
jgi:hypothetical protein